jgi:membrane fusion protein, multidrug efflux system
MERLRSLLMSNRRFVWVCLSLVAIIATPVSAGSAGETVSKPGDDPVRGIVRAVQQAMISTELQARASKINVQEGDGFRKGEVLVEFDCRRQQAQFDAAAALKLEASLVLDNVQFLQKAQAAGKHEMETARARFAKATAESSGLMAQLDDCILEAPFDGRVLHLGLQPHETPAVGKPFIGIIAGGKLEIDLIVASEWTPWLAVGTEFGFTVDETKTQHIAFVERVGAAVDPISQTIKIAATFKNAPIGVLPGMSGTAQFSVPGG